MALATRLGRYPYTYLRTLVMKRSLLTKPDYDKIIKMGANEISKYLEDLEYKKEVNELAVDYSGVELVERALQKNLGNEFDKLLRISSQDLKFLIKVYQKRYDFYNIKTIMRGKFNNMEPEEIRKHMSPVTVESNEYFEKLLAQKTVEESISQLTFLNENILRAASEDYKANNSLVLIENALDKHYYESVISQLAYLSTEGRVYKKFLLNEIDVVNVKLLLRLKKEGVSEQKITELIIHYGNLKREFLERAAKTDLGGVLKELENTHLKGVVENHTKGESVDLSSLEIDLDRFLMETSRKLIRQHPMSVDAVLGYMFLKDLEVKNITRLIKSKELGLQEDFIEKAIVV